MTVHFLPLLGGDVQRYWRRIGKTPNSNASLAIGVNDLASSEIASRIFLFAYLDACAGICVSVGTIFGRAKNCAPYIKRFDCDLI